MAGKKYGGRRAAAFVFDLDGTLITSGNDIAASANHVRRHYELPEVPPEVAVSYVGDGVVVLLRRILGHDVATGATGETGLPVDEERLAAALEVFFEHYERHCLDTTRLYPGVLDVLVRYRRFPLAVATNKPARFAHRILAGLKVKAAFHRIVCGDEVERKKPDPEAIARCVAGLDLEPAQIVVVGDSPNDIAAARDFGAVAVGATYGLNSPGTVKAAGPDHLIASLDELTGLFPSR
jgi:phosphoglycolate phosphatase